MSNRTSSIRFHLEKRLIPLTLLVAAGAALFSPGWDGWSKAQAAATDISTVPVFTSTPPAVEVKPNVMFIMDDSGSMAWAHMPDIVENWARVKLSADGTNQRTGAKKYGFVSAHCNGMYYNPAITYTPPVYADGTSYPDASFTAAWINGFNQSSGSTKVDLSQSFRAWYTTDFNNTGLSVTEDGAVRAYYYKYKGTQTSEAQKKYTDATSVFYRECNSAIDSEEIISGSTMVKNLFERVDVDGTTGPAGRVDERTNFANWFSYYRTRVKTMKTATGQAFKSLDDKFRVGFMVINANNGFLNISDFNATQKSSFYSYLYGSGNSGGTPIRAALSMAGRMYANKISTIQGIGVVDPVQYSCQQNYTILSTDGVWNESSGVVQLDGSTAIGNQDNVLPRPYNDGSVVTSTTVTKYLSTQRRETITSAPSVTRTWRQVTTVIGAACNLTDPPSNTVGYALGIGNSRQAGVGTSATNPASGRCASLGGGAWFCRSDRNNGVPTSARNASTTSSTGTTWYLVSDVRGQSGCISAFAAFGSENGDNFSTRAGVCPAVVTAGNRVTQTPYTQIETLTGFTSTKTDEYEAVQTVTETVTDGVTTRSPAAGYSPATPSYVLKEDLGVAESSATQTCGGQSAPCPNPAGTWTAGTPIRDNVCMRPSDQPAAGTTAPVATVTYTGQTVTNNTIQVRSQEAQTPEVTVVGNGGVANTLADVAAYYYATNLRTSDLGNCTGPTIAPSTTPNNLCEPNTVPATKQDPATWQHMTTFTLGLGVRGQMVFSPSYLKDTTGDYVFVKDETVATAATCSWRDSLTVDGGKCNWPNPDPTDTTPEVQDEAARIDDLWHAAVNGRGTYYSATDPGALAAGLSSTLTSIVNQPRPGTASAAATTNPKITEGNNFQFSSYFRTVEWSGELIRQTMNLTDGSVPDYDHMNPKPASYDWSAQSKLDAKAYGTRKIYTHGKNVSNESVLVDFAWGNLSATQQSYFTSPHISTAPPQFPTRLTGLTQFCATGTECISSTAQTATTVAAGGAAGEALVNFIRGDRTNEQGETTDNTKFFRNRKTVLGDIVSAQPQYVGAPSRFYSDQGYSAFKTSVANRTPIVYTAANDGMLHAFSAATGDEVWAYIPGMLLPNLYTLADKKYGEKHQYFVEGTPISGDICPKAPSQTCADNEWKTILVGGLNAGGTGYYALDITDPASPKLLWEFTDAAMGYTFGKPQITKLGDGTWVVLLTSGYNNCPRSAAAGQTSCALDGTGDGQGYLYVVNAATGLQVLGSPIATGVGSNSSPSGLAQIVAQADSNNVTRRVYGGDLYGNLWRFSLEPGNFGKHLLAVFKDSDGNIQPVTVRPQVTTINGAPVVYVGTGRYLGASDVGGTPKNSFYAIKDDLTTPKTYNNPRTYTSIIGQRAIDALCPSGAPVSVCEQGQVVRTVSQISGSANTSLTTQDGWFLDFPATAGEIQFTDPRLALGTLTFSTSVPRAATSQVCSEKSGGSDGDALAYMLDYLTGGAVGTATGVIATNLGAGVATAPQIAQLPNGTVIAKYRLSTGQEVSVPLRFGVTGGATRRISWRELVTE